MVAASSSDRERGGKEAPKILESQHAWLLARLAEQPEPMVRALTIELAERGNPASPNTVWVLLRRAGHSLKKTLSATEQDRPQIAKVRGAVEEVLRSA